MLLFLFQNPVTIKTTNISAPVHHGKSVKALGPKQVRKMIIYTQISTGFQAPAKHISLCVLSTQGLLVLAKSLDDVTRQQEAQLPFLELKPILERYKNPTTAAG